MARSQPASSSSAPANSAGDHTNAQSNQSRPAEALNAEEFSELEAAKHSETEGQGRQPLKPAEGPRTGDQFPDRQHR